MVDRCHFSGSWELGTGAETTSVSGCLEVFGRQAAVTKQGIKGSVKVASRKRQDRIKQGSDS